VEAGEGAPCSPEDDDHGRRAAHEQPEPEPRHAHRRKRRREDEALQQDLDERGSARRAAHRGRGTYIADAQPAHARDLGCEHGVGREEGGLLGNGQGGFFRGGGVGGRNERRSGARARRAVIVLAGSRAET
jgi:hypothetical protein